MKITFIAMGLLMLSACVQTETKMSSGTSVRQFPANGAVNVNPDTHLVLTFSSPPTIGTSGHIRIYDTADNSLVDALDLSVPVSPYPLGRAPPRIASDVNSGPAAADQNDKTIYQVTMIGGYDFHFFPIIVRGNVATIYPHNQALKYGHTYRVEMEKSVLQSRDPFDGYTAANTWTFTTKAESPKADSTRLVVSADGKGDFNTVQGAIDFVPANHVKRITIFIRNGNYEEIVFANGKSNLTFKGEDRNNVQIGYANNSAFNPSKGGPSRRPVFSLIDALDVQLSNFTINNYFVGQAEALLVRGQKIIVDHMTLNGSGDALTTYGSIYMVDSKLTGHGDTILGYAALYCLRCELHSIGPLTWTRTPKGSHGNVFVDSTFVSIDKPLPWTVTATDPGQKSQTVFARLPRNSPGSSAPNFPYAEMVVINSKTQGVPPEGWGPIEEAPGFDSSNVRFMEFNTRDLEGRPVDVSKRHRIVKQLTMEKDAKTIANYRDPEFVLGWKPVLR